MKREWLYSLLGICAGMAIIMAVRGRDAMVFRLRRNDGHVALFLRKTPPPQKRRHPGNR